LGRFFYALSPEDRVHDHNSPIGHFGDVFAAILGGIGALGTFAQALNPILTMVLTLLTIAWFTLRFVTWFRTGQTGPE
jgi:hypothetical protein